MEGSATTLRMKAPRFNPAVPYVQSEVDAERDTCLQSEITYAFGVAPYRRCCRVDCIPSFISAAA